MKRYKPLIEAPNPRRFDHWPKYRALTNSQVELLRYHLAEAICILQQWDQTKDWDFNLSEAEYYSYLGRIRRMVKGLKKVGE